MPFTRDQFFDVFASYNESVWPAQIVLLMLAVAIVVVPRWRSWLMATLWVWCAIA